MFGRARILSTITACMVALPAAAQAPAQTTTAFDGTYVGVSRTLEGVMGRTMIGSQTRQCPPSGRVAPLTIVNGIARTQALGTAEGSVSPQGALVMRALAGFAAGSRFEGQIDGQGTVTGRLTASCSYQVVWQKKGK